MRNRLNIVTSALVPRDAISNDVFEMADALAGAGYEVTVAAGGVDAACLDKAVPLGNIGNKHWRRHGDILIYHHSTGWPQGEELLALTRNDIVIRYHNITPAHYFEKYSPIHAELARRGIEATGRIARAPHAFFWGASEHNCADLIGCGAPRERCRVLPPLHTIPSLAAEGLDPALTRTYKDGQVNVLFVGGFKPNKAHARLINVFAAYYHWFNRRSRLILVGSLEPVFARYVEELRRLARSLGVRDRVEFCSTVSRSELRSYYTLADVFLCLSEHEGFCVPLVEAMFFRVPIVAWGKTAVAETVGNCGIVWDEYDEGLFAESIHACVEDQDLARSLRRRGWDRYHKAYCADRIRSSFLSLVAEAFLPSAGSARPDADRAGSGF